MTAVLFGFESEFLDTVATRIVYGAFSCPVVQFFRYQAYGQGSSIESRELGRKFLQC